MEPFVLSASYKTLIDQDLPSFLDTIILLAPVWVTILLVVLLWKTWMRYIQADFIAKEKKILLEVRLPREIEKSPLAMEVALTSLYQTGVATLIEKYWGGKVKPFFSLELESREGEVHFYVWTWRRFKNLVESQIYAQYPAVEIYEVPDYTTWLTHDPVEFPLWACEFKLVKPDPYPIKTYIDYGLEKPAEEEEKIDPMTSVIEYLGSMRQGEHVWIQIVIQAHTKTRRAPGHLFKREDWKEEAKREVEKILKEFKPKEKGIFPRPMTKVEEQAITAVQRSVDKYPFEGGIRGFYIARKESFNPVGITGLIGSVRQYGSNNLNSFRLADYTDYDYPWQDFRRIRRSYWEREFIEAYRQRQFFREPHKRKHVFILNTEELATMFHFPGRVAQTPTVERIPSRKVQPPANLPV